MTRLRVAICLAAAMWLAALLLLFSGVRPNLAHTLEHLLRDMRPSLPAVTTLVTMPVLGMTARPVFVLVWAALFAGPVLIGVQALRLPERRLVPFHLAAATLYLSAAGLLALLVLAGAMLPFALL